MVQELLCLAPLPGEYEAACATPLHLQIGRCSAGEKPVFGSAPSDISPGYAAASFPDTFLWKGVLSLAHVPHLSALSSSFLAITRGSHLQAPQPMFTVLQAVG
jgi:hypothetical protein